MTPERRWPQLFIGVVGLLWPVLSWGAAGQGVASPPAEGVYLFAYRTPAHVSRSEPAVFNQVADDLVEFLRSSNVTIVADPLRGMIRTDDAFSLESILNLAHDAGASHMLYLTVDRPAASWVKVTVECYEVSGKLVWQEKADDKGSWSGKAGLKKTLERIRKKLEPHVGQPGLPTGPQPEASPKPPASGKKAPPAARGRA